MSKIISSAPTNSTSSSTNWNISTHCYVSNFWSTQSWKLLYFLSIVLHDVNIIQSSTACLWIFLRLSRLFLTLYLPWSMPLISFIMTSLWFYGGYVLREACLSSSGSEWSWFLSTIWGLPATSYLFLNTKIIISCSCVSCLIF